jgi:hypothetical protein
LLLDARHRAGHSFAPKAWMMTRMQLAAHCKKPADHLGGLLFVVSEAAETG